MMQKLLLLLVMRYVIWYHKSNATITTKATHFSSIIIIYMIELFLGNNASMKNYMNVFTINFDMVSSNRHRFLLFFILLSHQPHILLTSISIFLFFNLQAFT